MFTPFKLTTHGKVHFSDVKQRLAITEKEWRRIETPSRMKKHLKEREVKRDDSVNGIVKRIIKFLSQRFLEAENRSLDLQTVLEFVCRENASKGIRSILKHVLSQHHNIVAESGRRYSFKPTIRANNRKQLVRYMKKLNRIAPIGVTEIDVKLSVPKADRVIELLLQSEDVVRVGGIRFQKPILFFNDKSVSIKIDERFRNMWNGDFSVRCIEPHNIEYYVQQNTLNFAPIRLRPLPPMRYQHVKLDKKHKHEQKVRFHDNVHMVNVLKVYNTE